MDYQAGRRDKLKIQFISYLLLKNRFKQIDRILKIKLLNNTEIIYVTVHLILDFIEENVHLQYLYKLKKINRYYLKAS